MLAERPKLAKDPQRDEEGEADAKVMEQEDSGSAGEGIIEASEAIMEGTGEEEEGGDKVERERSSCCAW